MLQSRADAIALVIKLHVKTTQEYCMTWQFVMQIISNFLNQFRCHFDFSIWMRNKRIQQVLRNILQEVGLQ